MDIYHYLIPGSHGVDFSYLKGSGDPNTEGDQEAKVDLEAEADLDAVANFEVTAHLEAIADPNTTIHLIILK